MRNRIIPRYSDAQRRPWLGFVLAGVVVGGCVTVPAEDVAESSEAAPATSIAAPSFSRDALYLLLVAELAERRGELSLAFRNYLEVAKRYADRKAAQRAVHIAMSSGDTRGGLEAVALWSELAPDSREPDEFHALLLIRAGALDEAVEVLRAVAAAAEVEFPGAGLRRVSEILLRELERNGSASRAYRDSAVGAMEALVAEHPDLAQAHLTFGQLLARVGEFGRAERAFERVLALDAGNEHATVLLARIHHRRNDLPRALRVLESALAERPASAMLRMTYARLLVDARRFEEARSHFELLLEADAGNEDVRYALGLVLFQARVFDRAAEHFEVLTRSIERRDAAWYYLGRIAEARQDPDAALAAYDRVLRGDNRMNAQLRIAVLLSEAGRVDEARSRLHALHGRSANEVMRLYGVEVDILVRHSRFDDAMEVYDAALAEWPEDAELLYARAMLAVELDDLVTAERDFSAIIERNPNHANALNALGYTLADRTDRLDEAYRLIKRAYELEPDSHYIVDSMGWVMFRMGRFEEALRFLWRAMQLGADPEIAAHLGEVLWTMGDRDSARTVWGNALEADPDDENLLDVKQRFGL